MYYQIYEKNEKPKHQFWYWLATVVIVIVACSLAMFTIATLVKMVIFFWGL